MQTIKKSDAIEIALWQQGSKEDMICVECRQIVGQLTCTACKNLLCLECFVEHECE